MEDTSHKYQYPVKPGSAPYRAARMVGVGRRVLELGSGPGALTRLLHQQSCQVTAVDYDASALKLVSRYSERTIRCDLNSLDWPTLLAEYGKFQCIVAADVLEHLYDPWSALQRVHDLLAEDGNLVLSLPHAAHNALIASLLNADFSYRPWGLLDKTHIRFFALRNMQALLNEAGFAIIDAEFVVRNPGDTELANHWRVLPNEVREYLDRTNKYGSIYQVVLTAVPAGRATAPLDLEKHYHRVKDVAGASLRERGKDLIDQIKYLRWHKVRSAVNALLRLLGLRS